MQPRFFTLFSLALAVVVSAGAREPAPGAAALRISVNHPSVGEGRTVIVTARLSPGHGAKWIQGVTLWPYLNGKQWGAPARTNQEGVARLMLPLPQPGIARIQVTLPPFCIPPADWIWSYRLAPHQRIYFQRRFHLGQGGGQAARMLLTGYEKCKAWLNGHRIGSGSLWRVKHFHQLRRFLKSGDNVLSILGYSNHPGFAPGLLARLTIHNADGTEKVIRTNKSWRCFAAKPAGWPVPHRPYGAREQRVQVIARVGWGLWGDGIQGWPGVNRWLILPVGKPPPTHVLTSNTAAVHVRARKFPAPPRHRHLVGMSYETDLTPLGVTWYKAEAISLIGRYGSMNPQVIRQHALWLDKMGINYIVIDWVDNLFFPGGTQWRRRPLRTRQEINATTLLLKTYAQMRRQGISTPQVTLDLGLNNGPPVTTTTQINKEMDWVYRKYIQNPRFAGLWLHYRHKPLILIYGGGPSFSGEPPINRRYFTVRWQIAQLEYEHSLVRAGYWSWMDGVIHPIATYHDGQCEALTITPAFFSAGGWLAPTARARDNGYTYLREFNTALRYRPHFLTICQWNEFDGPGIGEGWGPRHDNYTDCYNIPLSNDIEPTSLTTRDYHGTGGWGFYYLNLTRAFIHLYHQKHPRTTLLAIGAPHRGQRVKPRRITVRWACVGKAPTGFTLRLDAKIIARHIPPSRRAYTVDLRGVAPGRHTLTLQAPGCRSRFRLSYTHEARRRPHLIAARARIDFMVR